MEETQHATKTEAGKAQGISDLAGTIHMRLFLFVNSRNRCMLKEHEEAPTAMTSTKCDKGNKPC